MNQPQPTDEKPVVDREDTPASRLRHGLPFSQDITAVLDELESLKMDKARLDWVDQFKGQNAAAQAMIQDVSAMGEQLVNEMSNHRITTAQRDTCAKQTALLTAERDALRLCVAEVSDRDNALIALEAIREENARLREVLERSKMDDSHLKSLMQRAKNHLHGYELLEAIQLLSPPTPPAAQ